MSDQVMQMCCIAIFITMYSLILQKVKYNYVFLNLFLLIRSSTHCMLSDNCGLLAEIKFRQPRMDLWNQQMLATNTINNYIN